MKTDEDPSLYGRKLCNNKFTWCFHKPKQVYCIHHANLQGTYNKVLTLQKYIRNNSTKLQDTRGRLYQRRLA